MKLVKLLLLSIICISVDAQQISEPSFNSFSGILSSNGNTVIASVGDLIIDELGNDEISLDVGVEVFSVVVLDIESEKAEISYTIYPNPTLGEVFMDITADLQTNPELTIFDIKGKLIHQQSLQKGTNNIDVKHIKSGIYFLKVLEKKTKKLITIKLIKE